MTKTTCYVVAGIDHSVADELRAQGGINYVADEHPGFPCRQCLRDAEIGEHMILVSHDPFTGWSPYRSASPIFLHRFPCTPPADDGELPEYLTRRRLSVRAFDTSEMMLDATLVVDGQELGAAIERLLENPAIDHLHVHNEPRGCFAARIERPAPD